MKRAKDVRVNTLEEVKEENSSQNSNYFGVTDPESDMKMIIQSLHDDFDPFRYELENLNDNRTQTP